MMTGQHEHNGRQISLRPDPCGRWIVAANYLTDSAGYEGAADVADALRRLAAIAGDTGAPAWSPQYDLTKLQIREGLAPGLRELFDLIAPPSDREPDIEEGAKLASVLAEGGKRVQWLMDPVQALAEVPHPVHVLHGTIRLSDPVLGRSPASRSIARTIGIPRDGYTDIRALRAGSASFSDASDARDPAALHRPESDLWLGLVLAQHLPNESLHFRVLVIDRLLDKLARVGCPDAEKRTIGDDTHVGGRPREERDHSAFLDQVHCPGVTELT